MENKETELLRHIFIRALITGDIQVHFAGMDTTVAEVIEGNCYQTLQRIREILDDHTLSDENLRFLPAPPPGEPRRTTNGRPYILNEKGVPRGTPFLCVMGFTRCF